MTRWEKGKLISFNFTWPRSNSVGNFCTVLKKLTQTHAQYTRIPPVVMKIMIYLRKLHIEFKLSIKNAVLNWHIFLFTQLKAWDNLENINLRANSLASREVTFFTTFFTYKLLLHIRPRTCLQLHDRKRTRHVATRAYMVYKNI